MVFIIQTANKSTLWPRGRHEVYLPKLFAKKKKILEKIVQNIYCHKTLGSCGGPLENWLPTLTDRERETLRR